ncbi:MAG TPA: Asp-tRNA(Asn)/Glu-tRNA(Gln) amidotransferase subunit GatC [Alphaproteobacteria bacterium]|nr:Asp-tRNA(Asn)/Glu-tRNA(Gln) amidotransferase subunit GatC [Alphaproteobacteria bacterium]
MAVDEETVRKIARLARIKLPESAVAPMAVELSKLLNWVEQLGELDTSKVEPMTTAIAMKLKMRKDVVTDGGYEEDIVRNAPAREDTFFTVPKVVE